MRNFWTQFKIPLVTILIFFFSLAIYTTIFGPIPFRVNNVNTNQTDIFTASGEGEATAVPDEATLSLGVTKTSATVADAQKQANSVANKLIADLKTLGIKDSDIKTTNYSVNPNYSLEVQTFPTRNAKSGYEVTQNIEVRIKPIELSNKVIDTATKDGANLVGGLNFTFSDSMQKELEAKATKLAVDNAKEKANSLASSAGIRLGRVINVVSSNTNPVPVALNAQKAADATQTNVTPGQGSVKIGVTLYYETF